MSRLIRLFLAFADGLVRGLLWITMVLLVTLIVTTIYEVIARYGFSAPTMWAFDTSYMINGALFLVASGFALHVNGHVRIDVFSSRLPIRYQLVAEVAFYGLLFLPAMAMLTRAGIAEAWHAYVTDDRVLESAWMPLIWPFYAALAIGVGALFVQALATLIRALIKLFDPASGPAEENLEDPGYRP